MLFVPNHAPPSLEIYSSIAAVNPVRIREKNNVSTNHLSSSLLDALNAFRAGLPAPANKVY
jgi:hypothetical protein